MLEKCKIPSLSVVIPVFNEEDTINSLLYYVSNSKIVSEIIVIDDCSTDKSVPIIKETIENILKEESHLNILFSQNKKNMGKGASLRAGFELATCDVIVIQDADLEYDPSEYERLIKPIVDGNADVVYGSRFIGGNGPKRLHFFWHTVANKILTLLAIIFTNLNMTDMETGFKVFKKKYIDANKLEQNSFGIEAELTLKLAKQKVKFFEIPISYNGRSYEQGKKIISRSY